ncbi:hypothetical protein GF391_04280 [Candidatus Uhrbacteria bacterium]|nr:hypothetical protein [Candidatus Uhrbacteria bacterium]
MQEPVHVYPFAPEFQNPKFGAGVLNHGVFLQLVTHALITDVPNAHDPLFLLRLEHGLTDIVCSAHGPKQSHNNRFQYRIQNGQAHLDRSMAYPPLACIVTIMRRDEFLRRHNFALAQETTHVITAVNVIHGHEHDLSNSLPVSG